MESDCSNIENILQPLRPKKARFVARKLPFDIYLEKTLSFTTTESTTETHKPSAWMFPKESRDEITNDTESWLVMIVNDEPEAKLTARQIELGSI